MNRLKIVLILLGIILLFLVIVGYDIPPTSKEGWVSRLKIYSQG